MIKDLNRATVVQLTGTTLMSADYIQGTEWVLAKKSEKCVMPSSVGNGRELIKELWRVRFPAGGSGGPPPENLLI